MRSVAAGFAFAAALAVAAPTVAQVRTEHAWVPVTVEAADGDAAGAASAETTARGLEAVRSVFGDERVPRVSIEAGRSTGWRGVVGRDGLPIGIDRFGASAKDKDLATYSGLTSEAIASRVKSFPPVAP